MIGPLPHVQALLDDITARRQRLDVIEAAVRDLYGLPADAPRADATAEPRRQPAAVVPPARQRAPCPARAAAATGAPTTAPTTDGGKYDAAILRVLRSEAALHGLSTSDVTRGIVGPGKPAEVSRLVSSVDYGLKALAKRGAVRKDGRFWFVVRTHDREDVSA